MQWRTSSSRAASSVLFDGNRRALDSDLARDELRRGEKNADRLFAPLLLRCAARLLLGLCLPPLRRHLAATLFDPDFSRITPS